MSTISFDQVQSQTNCIGANETDIGAQVCQNILGSGVDSNPCMKACPGSTSHCSTSPDSNDMYGSSCYVEAQSCTINNGVYPNCPDNMWPCCPYNVQDSSCSGWVCTPVDTTVCPSFGTADATASFQQSNVNSSGNGSQNSFPNGQSTPVNCQYNALDFTSITQAEDWRNFSWEDPITSLQNLNNFILPSVCARTASSLGNAPNGQSFTQYCPMDPMTGETMTDCSRMVMVNDPDNYGVICSEWCSNNSDACNSAQADYCQQQTTPDCDCIDRGDNPTFMELNGKGGLSTLNPNCWWTPCSSSNLEPYLVPTTISSLPCPTQVTICKDVLNAINEAGGSIMVGTQSGVVDCNQGSNSSGQAGRFDTEDWIILAVIVIVIILVVVIGAVIIF